MQVVPETQREKEMRRIGLTDAVIALSIGKTTHEIFDYRCETPFFVYHGARVPAGEMIVPLWECGDVVTAARVATADKLEFIRFGIECPDDFEIIAGTEQGLLGHLFLELFEDNNALSAPDFDKHASEGGFRYLQELIVLYNSSDHSTAARHDEFVRNLVSSIDQRENGRRLGRS